MCTRFFGPGSPSLKDLFHVTLSAVFISSELFIIEDDNLFNDLLEFATEHDFTNIMPPIAKDLGRKIIF